MSGLIKQVLLDLHKLPLEQRADIVQSIEILYTSGVFTARDIHILNTYLSGYIDTEIALLYNVTTEYVHMTLDRIIRAIETQSGYTDARFIGTLARTGKYKPYNLSKLSLYLKNYGSWFSTHDPITI